MDPTGGADGDPAAARGSGGGGGTGAGRWAVGAVCGGLVYYHCAVRRASAVSLAADVLLVLLCSLSILGLLFRHLHISAFASINGFASRVPVDPLEWQISQEMANSIVASLANTIGAAESVLRVAATGHDKKLFFKVVFTLYFLASLGRVVSGAAVAYAALCIFCLYMFAQSTDLFDQLPSWVPVGRDSLGSAQDTA
ncbi:Reticulon-like protein B23 [Dichanthelium oligosanthes]|uniref:Reticulon-like protein B23 n=1 Tax=Dichanthelium oligosanthes TaxID=888268 RepID=A0A1E5V3F5_9POAL|nr:Reticulon-like protein B23 [Dichanthelium oligosanthes]